LQTDLGPELLEEVKREADSVGLSASAWVRMLVKHYRVQAKVIGNWPVLSEKGAPKKRASTRRKMRASGTKRKP